ncbi:MAG: GNAT family N-acetyltransferase [Actinomycetota bacterium]|nr:GNAT family N-acetyltransferase [Actinomycetota bacterium]
MRWTIRPAEPADVAELQHIEVDAGRLFAEIGMESIAEDDPPTDAELLAHIGTGTAWVAVDEAGDPVGYALASTVDDEGHLDQVSLRPRAAGHGIGAALIEVVCGWADAEGHDAVTLTTFRDVAWNGPYYRRLGFVDVDDAAMGPELAAVRRGETDAGLDVAPRIAMRRSPAR